MTDLIKIAENAFEPQTNAVEFGPGDTITVHYKIREGNKERIQNYRGVVIQKKGEGNTKTFTVRKMSGNIGVERIFPLNSPFIDEIEINKKGSVRRAKLYYLRGLTGKKARIKEKDSKNNKFFKKASGNGSFFLPLIVNFTDKYH